jgi:hypothetical protein
MSVSESAAIRPAKPRFALVPWLAERRVIFAWLLGSRMLVFVTALTMHVLHRPHGFLRQDHAYAHPLGVLTAWDGQWYQHAAERGYLLVPGRPSDPAFFPLYPLLLRVFHSLGLSFATAGVVLSNLVFIGAVLLFHELGREYLPREQADRAAVYLAIVPMGFVFSMAYPEGLVLAAMLAAALSALRGRWWAATLLAAAASLARPEGIFIAIPLAAIAHTQWNGASDRKRGQAVAAVLAGPVGLLAYPSYLGWALHEPFAWLQAEHAWGRSFHASGFYDAFAHLGRDLAVHPWYARDVVFLLAYAVLIVVALRSQISRSWVLAGAFAAFLPLATGSVESAARFGVTAPVFYWAAARLVKRRSTDLAVCVSASLVLVWWTVSLASANP